MQAQALYLKYNNLQLKVAKNHIDRSLGDIGQDFSSITLQISNHFKEAFNISKGKKIRDVISSFK